MESRLLDLLVCPTTRQPLQRLDSGALAALEGDQVPSGHPRPLGRGAPVEGARVTVTAKESAHGFEARSDDRLDATEVINLDAKLQAVPVQTIVPGNATTVTGIELAGFNVQVSGDDAQQSNSLLINIPQSLLPDDTSSLEARAE